MMNLRTGTSFLVATIVIAFAACAQTKKGTSGSNDQVKLVEATRQEMLPGVPGGDIYETLRLVLIWNTAEKPESFFWRGEAGWMNCQVNKIHQKPGATPATDDEDTWYTTERISFDDIQKGDTLELIPVAGGKYPIPDEIPETAKKTIFYKTAAKPNWLSLPVKTIRKKPSIAMP